MVVKRFKRPYLDSSAYIAAIKDEVGRAKMVEAVLFAADHSEIQIVASTFVAAEIIRMKGEPQPLTVEKEREIDVRLRSERIVWVELDFSLAVEARHIARSHGLKPGDAIHLAAALRGRADILLTYDKSMLALADAGIEIAEPYWHGTPHLFDA